MLHDFFRQFIRLPGTRAIGAGTFGCRGLQTGKNGVEIPGGLTVGSGIQKQMHITVFNVNDPDKRNTDTKNFLGNRKFNNLIFPVCNQRDILHFGIALNLSRSSDNALRHIFNKRSIFIRINIGTVDVRTGMAGAFRCRHFAPYIGAAVQE